jgi:protease I
MEDKMRLKGKRVAVLIAEGFEDLEFWVTLMRLQEAGATTTAVGVKAGEKLHGKNGLEGASEVAADAVKPDDFDALVIPGGWAPDKLRRYDSIKKLVKGIYDQGKVVGIICHGGLVAISAGIIQKGGKVTGSLGIKDDLVNAGGVWADESAFRDGQLVWGRVVADIPNFCRELVAAIE